MIIRGAKNNDIGWNIETHKLYSLKNLLNTLLWFYFLKNGDKAPPSLTQLKIFHNVLIYHSHYKHRGMQIGCPLGQKTTTRPIYVCFGECGEPLNHALKIIISIPPHIQNGGVYLIYQTISIWPLWQLHGHLSMKLWHSLCPTNTHLLKMWKCSNVCRKVYYNCSAGLHSL